MARVLALRGAGVVPVDTPVLRADDLGVLRGEGVFETLHVRQGQPWLLDEHLTRLAASAERLEIVPPPRAALTHLAGQACAAWPSDEEGVLRLVCTRGSEEGEGQATVFATVGAVSEQILQTRQDGVAVLFAALGVPVGLRPTAPWMLGGTKNLSYAVNMACLRWAAAQGADDVLWTSAEGYVLEAPTSSLVWLADGVLCTVPPEETGILPGITAAWLLDQATELGLQAERRLVRKAELYLADGVWLASSVRGLVEVRSIDSEELSLSGETHRLRKLLGH